MGCNSWNCNAVKLPVTNAILRSGAVFGFPAIKVCNVDLSWSIDRQLCGPSADKEFLLPGSCHPWAPGGVDYVPGTPQAAAWAEEISNESRDSHESQPKTEVA